MDNIIDWQIPFGHFEEMAARKATRLPTLRTYWHEFGGEEATIIATYFTNVWLHAHEHTANLIPGSYPSRSYNGQQMHLSIGRYYVTLTFDVCVLDEEEDWVERRWIADIIDTKNSDILELFVQTDHDDVPSTITSQIGRESSLALLREIGRRCYHEFGVEVSGRYLIDINVGYPIGMEVTYA